MEFHAVEKAISAGLRKVTLQDQDIVGYMVRSVLAGLYLGLIVFLYWNLVNNLGSSPFGKVVASLFFGVGLFVIIMTNSELFTSNNMYLTMSSLARQTSWSQTVRLWILCYLGNLIGALTMALLLMGAGALEALPKDHALYTGALHKTELPAAQIFFRGILANWVVCMAVWVSMQLKEEIARLVSIVLIVSIFLYLGFEHSIANLGTFSMALLGQGTVTFAGVAHNLVWATLGNIVGGGFFIGTLYWHINQRQARQAKGDMPWWVSGAKETTVSPES